MSKAAGSTAPGFVPSGCPRVAVSTIASSAPRSMTFVCGVPASTCTLTVRCPTPAQMTWSTATGTVVDLRAAHRVLRALDEESPGAAVEFHGRGGDARREPRRRGLALRPLEELRPERHVVGVDRRIERGLERRGRQARTRPPPRTPSQRARFRRACARRARGRRPLSRAFGSCRRRRGLGRAQQRRVAAQASAASRFTVSGRTCRARRCRPRALVLGARVRAVCSERARAGARRRAGAARRALRSRLAGEIALGVVLTSDLAGRAGRALERAVALVLAGELAGPAERAREVADLVRLAGAVVAAVPVRGAGHRWGLARVDCRRAEELDELDESSRTTTTRARRRGRRGRDSAVRSLVGVPVVRTPEDEREPGHDRDGDDPRVAHPLIITRNRRSSLDEQRRSAVLCGSCAGSRLRLPFSLLLPPSLPAEVRIRLRSHRHRRLRRPRLPPPSPRRRSRPPRRRRRWPTWRSRRSGRPEGPQRPRPEEIRELSTPTTASSRSPASTR